MSNDPLDDIQEGPLAAGEGIGRRTPGGLEVYRSVAPPPAEHTCSTCPYYFRYRVSLGRPGMCRRFPRYEVRQLGDWCGEHPKVAAGVQAETWAGQHKQKLERLDASERDPADPGSGASHLWPRGPIPQASEVPDGPENESEAGASA